MTAGAMVKVTTVVVARQAFRVRVDTVGSPRSVVVTVATNDGREWLFDEPGWRALCYGVAGGQFYWWSARHLVAMPVGQEDGLAEVRTAEDILFAFATGGGRWLLACETSVLLFDQGHEIARADLPEVTASVGWEASRLLVRDVTGETTTITVTDHGFVA